MAHLHTLDGVVIAHIFQMPSRSVQYSWVLQSAIHKNFEALVPLYCDFEPHPHLDILLLLVYCRDQGVQDTLPTVILRF